MHIGRRIGVLMGGFTPERHVSLESGRNVYNHLVASGKYDVLPLFLSGSLDNQLIFSLPIFLLLRDNADDIHDFLLHPGMWHAEESISSAIRQEALSITCRYAKDSIYTPVLFSYAALKERVDFIFIALHGKPGEDGTLQKCLETYDIPYNGSGIQATALTIDKYATNQFLKQKKFHVARQYLLTKEAWHNHQAQTLKAIEEHLAYPMIAKPVDDGCSSGVMQITSRTMLQTYMAAVFGMVVEETSNDILKALVVPSINAMLQRDRFLLEAYIASDPNTLNFLEITTGLLTHVGSNGETLYEVFESSEVLSAGTILSLEEKFLAGEGHNITPAHFDSNKDSLGCNALLSQIVKAELAKVAQTLGLQGYARIDAFVKVYPDQKVEVWIIEINALPAMTPATCIFHQCILNGYTPFDFIDAIVQYGFTKRHFASPPL